jgi:soluble lytic murein transglycosylase
MKILRLLITLCIFCVAIAQADSNTLSIQRTLFLRAHDAVQQHHTAQFQTLCLALQGYALYPYLVYWNLLQNIDHISKTQVDVFAKTYADTPLADLLKEKWAAAHLPPSPIKNVGWISRRRNPPTVVDNAIALARNHDPQAMAALNKIPAPESNSLVKEWRVRTAILQQNWYAVISLINQLSPTERATTCWQYWRAYALAKTNNLVTANAIYKKLATQLDYYGWLASQQLHLNEFYHPSPALRATSPTRGEVKTYPGFQRAHELYILKFYSDARREWNWELNKLTPAQLTAAAYLAQQWGWYDRAIITAAKAHDYHDLTLRFPLAYAAEIKAAAKQFNLDPAWAFAIARQESGFTADLKSNAGAFGLMQVMPHTAHLLSKEFSLPLDTENAFYLLNVNTNTQLGCAYLKQLSTWFKGNIVMATAAYNIGPTALQKYLAGYKTLGSAAWIETLPWQATREYVKNVLLAKAIYQQQLAK